MKYTICTLLYCTLFVVNSVDSLSGGVAVALGAHPSHALVLVNGLPHGGTIVNLNHVVTSCSIVLDSTNNHLRPLAQFTIRAGSITFAGGFTSAVTAVFPHPECDPWTLQNDVAVIRTTTNFPFNADLATPDVAPALFHERVVPDATNCVVVGFNAPVNGIAPLQQLTQPISNRDTVCNQAHLGRVLETMFCAGGLGAGSGICASTIGGGIYCFGNFTGIASSGAAVQCGAANSPGIYTQVRHHITWINAQFTRTQIPAAGATPPPGVVSSGILLTVTHSILILAFLLTRL